MLLFHKCLIQIDYGSGVNFVGKNGVDTPDLQQAAVFEDELAAHVYIDEHGLDRLARVRPVQAK